MKHAILNIAHAAILISLCLIVVASENMLYLVCFAAGYVMHAVLIKYGRKAKSWHS